MNNDPNTNKLIKLAEIFYLIIMPIVTVILLLGVSSIIQRPKFMGSFVDLAIRVLLILWFCTGYILIPRLKKYRFYPNITWSKADVRPLERIYYIAMAILFGVGITVITRWVLLVFLPIFGDFGVVFAILNGLLYAIPMIAQYQVFKL
jgi:hypothetical protein